MRCGRAVQVRYFGPVFFDAAAVPQPLLLFGQISGLRNTRFRVTLPCTYPRNGLISEKRGKMGKTVGNFGCSVEK